MNEVTEQKRRDLALYIEREVVEETAVQAIIVIGSVATGVARPDSDIDAVVFLDPLDLYTVPAEAKWQPEDNSFHSIMTHVENGIQLDFKRFDLQVWSQPSFVWPEPLCAKMQKGWLAFDRNGRVAPLIKERTTYSESMRQARLDDAFLHLDQLLDPAKANRTWDTLGAAVAHDRLNAAYDHLVQALFAYNGRWRTLRSRELTHLTHLPWLPVGLEENLLSASNALSTEQAGYQQRLATLRHLFEQTLEKCQQASLYGTAPLDEAFMRLHNEPGRAWNMTEWVQRHQANKNVNRFCGLCN
ncbi:MAG: nucleotidyltransferase domain-containing protein [Chloroflexota bacterium]